MDPQEQRQAHQDETDYVSKVQDLILQGIAAMPQDKEQARLWFQRAAVALRSALHPSAPHPPRTPKPPQLAILPVFQQQEETVEASLEQQGDDSFLAPFAFLWQSESSSSEHPEAAATTPQGITAQQLSACTAVLLFNLGLCHQHQAGDANLAKAKRLYERAWECACRYLQHDQQDDDHQDAIDDATQSGLLTLQMATSLNLAHCCFQLGQLQASHQWQQALHAVLEYHDQQQHTPQRQRDGSMFHLSEEWLHFFHMASILRTHCCAAGAA